MTLTRALHAEALKMKRTIAMKMVVLAPVAVVLLTLFMASQAPFSTLRRGGNTVVDPWRALSRVKFSVLGPADVADVRHATNSAHRGTRPCGQSVEGTIRASGSALDYLYSKVGSGYGNGGGECGYLSGVRVG